MNRTLFTLLLWSLLAPAPAATIAISCGAVGVELAACREGAETWARQTGHEVTIVSTPNSSSDRLALYLQLLSARSPDIDVFQIDVVWPGILHPHLIDLAPALSKAERLAHFPQLIENNTVGGRLLALPWFIDAGLLYYRRDLLEKYDRPVPQQWQELARTAEFIQTRERAAGRSMLWGFVWQGRAYEGLTCNALEWVRSFGGGTIIRDDGAITINNPRAVFAIDQAASWVGSISPIGVLNYDEEDSRGVFQSGNAVFMRNWPYAWALADGEHSAIRGKVGIAPLPRGGPSGRHTAALGGWQLAVSRYSRSKEAAVELVRYLTGPREQKRRAIVAGYQPTYPSLYRDVEVLAANPLFERLYPLFQQAVARPSDVTGTDYNRVSSAFWNAVHATLSGRGSAAENLARLERRLHHIAQGGWGR